MNNLDALDELAVFSENVNSDVGIKKHLTDLCLILNKFDFIEKTEFVIDDNFNYKENENYKSLIYEVNSSNVSLLLKIADKEKFDSYSNSIAGLIKLGLYVYQDGNISDKLERDEENIFKTLVYSSMDAILVLDPKKGYVDANPAAVQLFGFSSKDLLLKENPGMLSPEFQPDGSRSAESAKQMIQDILKKGQKHFEWIHKKFDGTHFPASVSATVMKIGNKVLVQGIIRDLTESKKAEAALRKSKTRLNVALEGAKSGIWEWNVKTNEVFFDENYFRIAGYEPNEYPHSFEEWKKRLHPEDYDNAIKNVNDYLDGKIDNYQVEFRFLTKSGDWIWILSQGKRFKTAEIDEPVIFTGIHTDITLKKKAEEEQKQLESNYQDIFNKSSEAIYIQDKDGKFIVVNDAVADMYGYPKESFIGKTPEFLSAPGKNNLNEIDDYIEKAFEGEPQQFDFWGIRLNGEIFPKIVRCHNGTYKGQKVIIAYALDITSRKKAEEYLKHQNKKYQELNEKFLNKNVELKLAVDKAEENERYFKTLFKNAGISIQIFDPNGIAIDANKSWEALWETKFSKIKNRYNVLQDESIQDKAWFLELKEAFKGKTANLPLIEYDPAEINEEGRRRSIKGIAFPIRKGNEVERVVLVAQDVTEEMKAEQELKESQEKLTKLFETMTEYVIFFDLVKDENGNTINYRVIDCNNAFVKLMQTKKEKIIGKYLSDVYRDNELVHLEALTEVAEKGKFYEFTYHDKISDSYYKVSAVSPKKGTFVTISTDITAMKRIEEVVRTKNKELENFVYVASHDLRSPLVNIQGFSKLLADDIEILKEEINQLEIPSEQKSLLIRVIQEGMPNKIEFVLSGVKKMNVLINGLLKISRTGRENVISENIDLNEVIRDIISTVKYQLENYDVEVEYTNLIGCYGDKNLINQLFSNLFSNSIKFRNPDRKLKISISSKSSSNNVTYTFKDNGIGIDDFNLQKIWDVFYQVESSKQDEGEGIGLNIVKRIVDIHNGRIWVESDFGHSTTFFIELKKNEQDK